MVKDQEAASLPTMMNRIQIQVPMLSSRDGEYSVGGILSIEMCTGRHHGPLVKITYMSGEGKMETFIVPLASMLSALKTMAAYAEDMLQDSGRWIMESEK